MAGPVTSNSCGASGWQQCRVPDLGAFLLPGTCPSQGSRIPFYVQEVSKVTFKTTPLQMLPETSA